MYRQSLVVDMHGGDLAAVDPCVDRVLEGDQLSDHARRPRIAHGLREEPDLDAVEGALRRVQVHANQMLAYRSQLGHEVLFAAWPCR